MSLSTLVLIAAVTAFFAHLRIRSYVGACLLSAGVTEVLFQWDAYSRTGFLDKFFLVSVLFIGIYSILVAGCVGLPFVIIRSVRAKRFSQPLLCSTCGYSLQGLTDARCSECGTPFEKKEQQKAENQPTTT